MQVEINTSLRLIALRWLLALSLQAWAFGQAFGGGDVEARPELSVWKAVDQGEWMELRSGCIPRDTQGLVIIPRELGGKPVRVIGDGAFAGCQQVTDIRVPDTVRMIGKDAFVCSRLKTINLPAGLEEIGDAAFLGCVALPSLELPAALSAIGKNVFPQGRALVVHLPKAESARLLRLIGTINDKDDFDPPMVTFAEDPTEAEKMAGKNPWLFYFDQDRLMIGDVRRCAAYPSGLAGELQIPMTVAGRTVYGIGENAFLNCVELTSVTIPKGIRYVGNAAFEGCSGLTSVEVPVGVTEFVPSAFSGCDNVVSATLPGGDENVYCYLQCANRLRFLTIADGSTIVGDDQFCGCFSLLSVTLPSTLLSIGRYAFQGCCELRSVALPEKLVEVGDMAFADCDKISALKIPGSLSYVSQYAFAWMSGLKTLVIDEGVRIIAEEAFIGCKALAKVSFPSTLQVIDRMAFAGCCSITSLDLPEGLLMIEEQAFDGVRDVLEICIPSTLMHIGCEAFTIGADSAVRVAPGDVERVSGLFAEAQIKFEKGQIVEAGKLTRREQAALATRLANETFTSAFLREFASLSPGKTIVVGIPNARTGLKYAIAVSPTIEGLVQAVSDAPKSEATAAGVEIEVVRPAGNAAFFLMVVEQL